MYFYSVLHGKRLVAMLKSLCGVLTTWWLHPSVCQSQQGTFNSTSKLFYSPKIYERVQRRIYEDYRSRNFQRYLLGRTESTKLYDSCCTKIREITEKEKDTNNERIYHRSSVTRKADSAGNWVRTLFEVFLIVDLSTMSSDYLINLVIH